MENACVSIALKTAFGSLSGNSINPVGMIKLIVVGATYLKCPRGKGNNQRLNEYVEWCYMFRILLKALSVLSVKYNLEHFICKWNVIVIANIVYKNYG